MALSEFISYNTCGDTDILNMVNDICCKDIHSTKFASILHQIKFRNAFVDINHMVLQINDNYARRLEWHTGNPHQAQVYYESVIIDDEEVIYVTRKSDFPWGITLVRNSILK